MSGTSMATPHVAGIAALLLSTDSTLTYADLKSRLIQSCDKVRVLSRKVLCGGRVNVANALHRVYPEAVMPAESAWKDVDFTTLESAHPYENGKAIAYGIAVPNAKKIRIIFESIDTEAGYDTVSITQKNGDEIESLSGTMNQYVSDYLDGDQAVITLKADGSINKFGFKVGKVQAVY